ncbi:hypothetical protein PG984_006804 [Apiospora sp. TS-2023a]
MDINHFLSVSLDRMSRRLGAIKSPPSPVPSLARLKHPEKGQNQLVNLKRERIEVERRFAEIDSQNDFLVLLLRRINPTIIELRNNTEAPGSNKGYDDLEEPFYRYHRKPSHKIPSESLRLRQGGIVCPGWRKHGSGEAGITKTHVRQHFTDGDTSHPPFISASDDPARIYNIMSLDRERTDSSATILVISPSRLRMLGIRFQRSADLVHQFGLDTYSKRHPNGVHYATDSHWMIHQWVPEECIMGEMTIHQFLAFRDTYGSVNQYWG